MRNRKQRVSRGNLRSYTIQPLFHLFGLSHVSNLCLHDTSPVSPRLLKRRRPFEARFVSEAHQPPQHSEANVISTPRLQIVFMYLCDVHVFDFYHY